jgi:membrane fusion protein (multidrug efflux system)
MGHAARRVGPSRRYLGDNHQMRRTEKNVSQNRTLVSPYVWAALLCMVVSFFGCAEDAEPMGSGDSSVVVRIVNAEAKPIRQTLTRVGSIRAIETVEVSSEVPGIVRQIHFDEGDEVEAGQLLFSLDDRKLKKQVAAQEAALEAARSRAQLATLMFERFDQLLAEDAAAEAERDKRKTERETAEADINRIQAEIALLKERLRDTKIRASIQGALSESMADPGDFVKAGRVLTVLYSSGLEARFSVPEGYAARVAPGQTVELNVRAYPDETFQGTVTFISPGADEGTRTFLTKAKIEDPNGRLKSGMFATVDLILTTERDHPVIPAEALVATRDGYVVYVVEDHVARRHPVEIGLRRPGAVQIIEGLMEGQAIVLSGQMRLTDGTKVTLSEDTAGASESREESQGSSATQGEDAARGRTG